MTARLSCCALAVLLWLAPSTRLGAQSDEADRVKESAVVLHEIMKAADSAIPTSVLDKAEGIAVFPGTVRGGCLSIGDLAVAPARHHLHGVGAHHRLLPGTNRSALDPLGDHRPLGDRQQPGDEQRRERRHAERCCGGEEDADGLGDRASGVLGEDLGFGKSSDLTSRSRADRRSRGKTSGQRPGNSKRWLIQAGTSTRPRPRRQRSQGQGMSATTRSTRGAAASTSRRARQAGMRSRSDSSSHSENARSRTQARWLPEPK